ncbi:MAG TPA: serine hydrolase domain-containing protein [Burkholderiales bacterium]|nr:serine hydrolase domain-containing protein [Burkholderiales bacterium]
MTDNLAQALALLDTWAAHSAAQQRVPGVALAVVQGERPVLTRAYGFADLQSRTPATPQTPYKIGSLTKSFTALAVLQLVEDGKLRLDDRFGDHVPAAMHGPVPAEVTVRQLLAHTSGLQRDLPGTMWSAPAFPAALPGDFSATFPSGTQWKYSNVGYALLGELIAAAGGEPWARHLERRILAPLGMSSTQTTPRVDDPRLATGYSRPAVGADHAPARQADHGAMRPAGGMASTAEDMARYVAFHLGAVEGVLGARLLREMHRPQWLFEDWQSAWGLGVQVRRADGRVRVGHPGSTPGFSALMEFIPALKLGVVVLTNADDGNPAAFCDYALQLLAPIVAKEIARAAPALPADAARYCGLYRSENRNLTMFVAMLDGQLTLVPPGAPNPHAARVILEPTPEPHVFVMRSSGAFATLHFGERLEFTVAPGGEVTGYDMGSSARFVREPALIQTLYSGADRRGTRTDRRRYPPPPYAGVERRSGIDRRLLMH